MTALAAAVVAVTPTSYARQGRARFVEELQRFTRFETVSAWPERRQEMDRCALWLRGALGKAGFERSTLLSTPGPPAVYAEWCHRPGAPTVLLHGHYDVQPPDPHSRLPPFSGEVRGGALYGRGASDDKGQLWAHVKAFECWRAAGGPPCNVKVLVEGEEEIGSPHLAALVERARIGCDAVVVSDASMPRRGQPAITYAMRGALALEIAVERTGGDLHAGVFGGAIVDPLRELAKVVADLVDVRGRIVAPGFSARVRPDDRAERRYLQSHGALDAEILDDADAAEAPGDLSCTLYERATIRPAVTVSGLAGGYVGPGVKAVLPRAACARLDVRLVPDQRPREAEACLRRHVQRRLPPGLRLRWRRLMEVEPFFISPRHPLMPAARRALRAGFGAEPIFVRSGGSLPAAGLFMRLLRVPVLLMGFGLPHDRIHGPDEKFELAQLFGGMDAAIALLRELPRALTTCRVSKGWA